MNPNITIPTFEELFGNNILEIIEDSKLDEEKQQTAEVMTVNVPKKELSENQDNPYEMDSLINKMICQDFLLYR